MNHGYGGTKVYSCEVDNMLVLTCMALLLWPCPEGSCAKLCTCVLGPWKAVLDPRILNIPHTPESYFLRIANWRSLWQSVDEQTAPLICIRRFVFRRIHTRIEERSLCKSSEERFALFAFGGVADTCSCNTKHTREVAASIEDPKQERKPKGSLGPDNRNLSNLSTSQVRYQWGSHLQSIN